MPTTRKQKRARNSRGLEMLSDIEKLDIMLGGNHFETVEREERLNSNLLEGQKVPKVKILKMMMRTCIRTQELSTQVLTPISTEIQQLSTLVLRLIDCQVN